MQNFNLQAISSGVDSLVTDDVYTDVVDLGFNFDFYTNIYQTKNGKTYFFCYDHGYLDLGNDWFALVVKKEYV